jgi:hypothetical protein
LLFTPPAATAAAAAAVVCLGGVNGNGEVLRRECEEGGVLRITGRDGACHGPGHRLMDSVMTEEGERRGEEEEDNMSGGTQTTKSWIKLMN